MELQTRLVFIDTSAYQAKRFQFGHYDLAHLERMVAEKKFIFWLLMLYVQKLNLISIGSPMTLSVS